MAIPVLSLTINSTTSTSTTSRRLLLRSACHLQLYCTTSTATASTAATRAPNFARGSSLQTTIYNGNERRVLHDLPKHHTTASTSTNTVTSTTTNTIAFVIITTNTLTTTTRTTIDITNTITHLTQSSNFTC